MAPAKVAPAGKCRYINSMSSRRDLPIRAALASVSGGLLLLRLARR
jgi:hypothetical protein